MNREIEELIKVVRVGPDQITLDREKLLAVLIGLDGDPSLVEGLEQDIKNLNYEVSLLENDINEQQEEIYALGCVNKDLRDANRKLREEFAELEEKWLNRDT